MEMKICKDVDCPGTLTFLITKETRLLCLEFFSSLLAYLFFLPMNLFLSVAFCFFLYLSTLLVYSKFLGY